MDKTKLSEDIFEKFIIGGMLVLIIGFIIIWFWTVGSELINKFGLKGLWVIPLVMLIFLFVGLMFKLTFPNYTIYAKKE